MLLSPVLPEKSLTMLYAPRGIGKSWLGHAIGVAVASGGSLLKWQAPAPRRVLVADGEMPSADLQARLNSILHGLGVDVPNDKLRILAADNSEVGINLGSIEGQQALEPSRWCGPFDFGQRLDAPITRPRKALALKSISRRQRVLAGEGAAPFEATIEPLTTPDPGLPGIRWVARDLKPPIFEKAAELFARGLSVRAVKQALGISHGEAGHLRLRAAAEGL